MIRFMITLDDIMVTRTENNEVKKWKNVEKSIESNLKPTA